MEYIDNDKFKINLTLLRVKSGLSKRKLGMKIGIARSTISGIESGKNLPGALILYKLSIALNCTMEDLVFIEE